MNTAVWIKYNFESFSTDLHDVIIAEWRHQFVCILVLSSIYLDT